MIKVPGYRVLVTPDEIQTKTESGIVLEYAGNEKLEKGARITGTVVDIGRECWKQHEGNEPWCKVGDKVFWAKYAGKLIVDPYTLKEYIVLNDEDIVAVTFK